MRIWRCGGGKLTSVSLASPFSAPTWGHGPRVEDHGAQRNRLDQDAAFVQALSLLATPMLDRASGIARHRRRIQTDHQKWIAAEVFPRRYVPVLAGRNDPAFYDPSSTRMMCTSALIRLRWVNACGKLPRCLPIHGSISSAYRCNRLANDNNRSHRRLTQFTSPIPPAPTPARTSRS